ncbi:hypothetical protein CORC01_04806 [Colletotrichum orchidophilum]|uniref:Intradiol ring-cleavage dioxygenases domain-containing protein n=1 Tax=Colletotrichum orchidophilum TaxID=1209926 RepID=A0A1G4BEY1_9PEZI|nr:uncharacterized protein CORC01_04806 [Colletotrichum orchidophilum]OHE99905.1 hypothetical protein CORC01_04806 [Colletotrichum orchidophilum]
MNLNKFNPFAAEADSLPHEVLVFYKDEHGLLVPYPPALHRVVSAEEYRKEMTRDSTTTLFERLLAAAIMTFFSCFITAYIASFLIQPCSAHGTVNQAFAIAARQDYSLNNAMNLAHCHIHLEKRGFVDEAVYRRVQLAKNLQRLGITGITDDSVNWTTPDETIFATHDDGCVLSVETTEGPFYVEGELDRFDLTDGQSGIPMYLDLQIIDTETCEPVPDIWVEVWRKSTPDLSPKNPYQTNLQCTDTNSTGIYSGVVSEANGAGEGDPSNDKTTFHRGLRKTNANGAVWFGTNLPGHYSGRTPHVHIMTHAAGAEALPNGTVQDNVATHAGQLFLDQKLVDAFRKNERYADNDQNFIENERDLYFRQDADFTDPVMSYVLLDHKGRDIEKGVLAWKLVGVNMTNVREIHVANKLEG